MLDRISTQQVSIKSATQMLLKARLEEQIQTAIKPFLAFIPITFTFLFFISVKSIASLLFFCFQPLLWLMFWFLEKTHYTTYTTEMREVKKLVV